MLPQEEQDKKYGRIYNLRKMLEVILTLEIASGLDDGKELPDEFKEEFPPKSLSEYSRDDWKYIKERIESIQARLIRKDAKAVIGEEENAKTHTGRGRNAIYRQDKLVNLLTFQSVITPLRLAIKDQCEDEGLSGQPKVDQAIVDELR